MPAERTMEFLEPLMASLPPMSLHLLTGLLVGGFTVISLILGIAGQVEAGVFPPRGPLYKFFVSDAESYKQYRQPFRTIVAIFLVAFYAVFFFGPPYLIWREMYAEGLAAATKCVATRKKFGGLQCSVGCVVQGGNCVPL